MYLSKKDFSKIAVAVNEIDESLLLDDELAKAWAAIYRSIVEIREVLLRLEKSSAKK